MAEGLDRHRDREQAQHGTGDGDRCDERLIEPQAAGHREEGYQDAHVGTHVHEEVDGRTGRPQEEAGGPEVEGYGLAGHELLRVVLIGIGIDRLGACHAII